MKLKATTTTQVETTITLTGRDILDLLKEKYPEHFASTYRSKVYFAVPGGGDYSNCDVDIDTECPVHITLITETVKS